MFWHNFGITLAWEALCWHNFGTTLASFWLNLSDGSCVREAQGIDAAEMDYTCDVARGHGRSNLRCNGLLPALVVHGKIFSFRLGRFLTGHHLLALQGIPPWRLRLVRPFSYALANKLAGNAMTASVLGAIVMPLLAYARLGSASGQEPLLQPPARPLGLGLAAASGSASGQELPRLSGLASGQEPTWTYGEEPTSTEPESEISS